MKETDKDWQTVQKATNMCKKVTKSDKLVKNIDKPLKKVTKSDKLLKKKSHTGEKKQQQLRN